jgi:hypothetical protein
MYMDISSISVPAGLTDVLCRELRELARLEEDLAAAEAACVPYWVSCPPSVYARRAAADVLRRQAESISHAA